MDNNFKILAGSPLPQGTRVFDNGVNFALFSRHATGVTINIFKNFEDEYPIIEYDFDSEYNKTGDIWHVFIENIKEGFWYNYNIDGPFMPEMGYRYNVNKTVVDPYSKLVKLRYPIEVANTFAYDGNDTNQLSTVKNITRAPRSMIFASKGYDGIKVKRRPLREHVIYEMHVRGFTKHKSSKVSHPGTFIGVIEKIPHLKELGITAVEFLPLHIFDNLSTIRVNKEGKKLTQYWGYDPITFMAPHIEYAATKSPMDAIREFKQMVSELHKADIEVFLDVVFNHTCEGNEYGPTLSFKGIDNSIYYMLENGDKYKNYSGCGNTVNCAHPVVRDLILDTLIYWATEMGIDGFRFDLASVLSRDKYGNLQHNSPLIDRISENPILRDKIIIAEAWDAGGAYQVGSFGTNRWAEWNGRYRDDIRSFVKSDYGSLRSAVERIMGSKDLYVISTKKPENSINFITCHDGFTLEDLVSYNVKHNEANGENNKDGTDDNRSWNCGVEGRTRKKAVLELRNKQKKNFMTILMLSLGVPMILAGDEFGNTQHGNNNAYCQDNEISWLDWSLLEKNKGFFRFVKNIIAFRKQNPAFRVNHYYTTREGTASAIRWFGPQGRDPNWSADNFTVGCFITPKDVPLIQGPSNEIFFILNMHWEKHTFYLPYITNKFWYFVLDTAKDSPNDIVDIGKEYRLKEQKKYLIEPRSIVVLVAK